ncbi:MAG: pyruvate:ferredoxin (flavodoxin) oxidoreductase, partial [Clostridia bacterium]|nr:pyruvate:ferredoxin (flavodoxin) oxidoreductase [Clostridia bacterium]
GRVPFMHFFDGFRTSHEINKIETIPHEEMGKLLDREALDAFRAQALNPEHPRLRATVQNGDVYFQVREANNGFYDALPDIVEDYMKQIGELTGRKYHLFDYYGDPDATDVVVAMGSVSGTIREGVDALRAQGRKVGFVQVHLFRPFSVKHLMNALPAGVRRIAVLDRCKEMGALGEPLYQDICTAFSGRSDVTVVGGRYGLSSKDTDPAQIVAVFDNLATEAPKNSFSIGIVDDVTFRSLPVGAPVGEKADTISCKFWGLGSDGTVGANKNTVEIINDHTDSYAQAYFEYDAKKSFGVTKSHLRVSQSPITSSYYVKQADFVACHHQSYIGKYDMAGELKEGGTFLLNCTWSADELGDNLPADVKRTLAQKCANLYIINATEIASRLGLGSHTNTVLQAAFFHISSILDEDTAIGYMKDAVRKTYFAKGDAVVERNISAIDAGVAGVCHVNIPADWATAADDVIVNNENKPAVVRNILEPINAQKGDELPVSAFKGYEDGTIDVGLTAYEKRNIAAKVPVWNAAACLQCNRCSLVCPHAAIRPYLLTDDELANAPEGLVAVSAKGGAAKGYHYTLQISTADCTGCGSCVTSCPAKEKAIEMVGNTFPINSPAWSYALGLDDKDDLFDRYTVKGSQFCRPLLEFSAACAGCGETPYAKLLTQLFGDRVYWANATGCSQAWGSPMPGIPYTTNKKGHGPAWSNSLFENNAEFSLGMFLSVRQQREAQKMRIEQLTSCADEAVRESAMAWLENYDNYDASPALTDTLCAALSKARPSMTDEQGVLADDILRYRNQLTKKCFWMFGGDGWAYDIGFGGLDHVVASGEDVNMFIVDT